MVRLAVGWWSNRPGAQAFSGLGQGSAQVRHNLIGCPLKLFLRSLVCDGLLLLQKPPSKPAQRRNGNHGQQEKHDEQTFWRLEPLSKWHNCHIVRPFSGNPAGSVSRFGHGWGWWFE